MKINLLPGAVRAGSRCLAVSFLIAVSASIAPQSCLAQMGSDAFSAGDAGMQSRSWPITGSQTDTVNAGAAPMLQGATNGTIGPQAGDATVIQGINSGDVIVIRGINTAGSLIPGDAFDPHPGSPEPPVRTEPEAYEAPDDGPATVILAEPPELPSFTPTEVIREDPRGIDVPEEVSDEVRDNWYKVIAQSHGKSAQSSGSAAGLLQLGIAQGNVGQSADAIKTLNRAAKLDSGCDACLYNLGTVYSNQRRYVEALKCYNRALTVKKAARAYYHLAFTYSILGMHSMALKTFDQAARLDRKDKKTYFERAYSRMALGLNADAVADLNTALKNSCHRPSWIFYRGLALSRIGQHEEALADFDLALKLDDAPRYFSERGKVFLRLKEYDAALYDFNEALHRDTSLTEAYENRARVYTAIGRPGPATDDLLMAKRLSSGG